MSLRGKKWIPMSVGLVILVGVLGYFFYQAHILSNDDLKKRSYSWEKGSSYEYRVELQQKGWTAFEKAWATGSGPEAKPIPYEVKLEVPVAQFIVLDANDKATHFALVLPETSLQFTLADKSKALEDSTKAGLKAATYFTLGGRGGISQLMFAKESTTVSRNLVRTIIAEAFPQLRAGRLEEPFKMDTRWVNQQVKEFGPLKIKKTLNGFATERMPTARQGSQLNGTFEYDLGEGSYFLRSALGLIDANMYSGPNLVQQEHTELGVKFLQQTLAPADVVQNLAQQKAQAQPATLHGLEEFKETELAILRKRIEGLDFKTEWKKFDDLGPAVRIVDSYRQFEILLAFLKLHPELATEILGELPSLDAKDGRFDIYSMLLVKSDNPELQSQLLDFARDQWGDADKVSQILFNFALDKNLDKSMAEKVIQMYDQAATDDPNHNNIAMHLGSIGHEAADAEIKDAVRERIEKGLNEQKATEDKRPYVVALGNLGHPNTLEVAQPYVSSNNVRERQFGAEMLRRVDGPGAETSKQTLLNLAAHDPELEVRRDASKYLDDKQYQGDQLAQIKTLLFHEKDPNVAMNLVDVLGKGEADRAEAIAILQEYYKKCAHAEVCKKVEGIILGKRN